MIGAVIDWACAHLGPIGMIGLDAIVFLAFAQFVSRLREW